MKARLFILFLLLTPIASLFHSCRCDKSATSVSYSHQTLLVKNLDNSGQYAIETNSTQINKNAYGIRLTLIREKEIVAYIRKQNNSIFVQSAYAISVRCPEYIYSAKDSIVSIKIFTLNDFDEQHLENSDISDYFRIKNLKIEDYLASIDYKYVSYRMEEFEDIMRELRIDLLLMTTSTMTNNHQFKIQIILSDGRILEQETTKVQLL
jgi:hypothetical protein